MLQSEFLIGVCQFIIKYTDNIKTLSKISLYLICWKKLHTINSVKALNEKVFWSAEHVIPKKIELLSNKSKTCKTKFYKWPACSILSATYVCANCIKYGNQKSSRLKKW